MSSPETPEPPILVLGTRNRKKLAEMAELIHPPWERDPALERLRVLTLDDVGAEGEVEEDGATFAENARKKASEYARRTGRWVLADDSGLSVDALDGAPGVHSARYAGLPTDDEANNDKLIRALASIPESERGAAYHCVLALADPSGAIRAEVDGACRGRVVLERRGTGGFGYDPLFLIPEYHRTFGELSPIVKARLSHRARAFDLIRPRLRHLAASGAFDRG